MSGSAASIWSAIAATFSAIAAISIMLIQHRNMLDSARPELILNGWDRKTRQPGDHKIELITFNKIRNIGKGSALHILINSYKTIDDKPVAVLSTERLSVLPANEEYQINGKISLFWHFVPPDDSGHKHLLIKITILSWCSKGCRHETIYELMAVEPFYDVVGDREIAPGVRMGTRTTVSKSAWMSKAINSKLSRWYRKKGSSGQLKADLRKAVTRLSKIGRGPRA